MLRVVEEACRLEDGKLVVTLESESIEELLSREASTIAVTKAASCGFPRVGINKTSGPFPVDKDGQSYEDWADQSRNGLIHSYRNEIYLLGSI